MTQTNIKKLKVHQSHGNQLYKIEEKTCNSVKEKLIQVPRQIYLATNKFTGTVCVVFRTLDIYFSIKETSQSGLFFAQVLPGFQLPKITFQSHQVSS